MVPHGSPSVSHRDFDKDSESKKLGEFLLGDNCYIVISIVKN